MTLNPDGSYTLHTPTGDTTNFGANYLQQQGLDPSQGGQLTHLLIDTLGQRTDQWSWQGSDGTTITRTEARTLTQTNPDGTTIQQSASGVVTQTNADGSSVSYDPSTGNVTTKDGGWLGPATTFYPDGSVSQTSPSGTTMWDSSGQGSTIPSSFDGAGFPMSTSEPAPTAPAAPSFIVMPHDPTAPVVQTPVSGDAPEPNSSDQSSTGDDSNPPAPVNAAPVDVAPASVDVAPAPVDATPPSVDVTPPPGDPTPPAVDTTPSLDSGSVDSGSLDSGGFDGGGVGDGGGGGDAAASQDTAD